MRSRSWMAALTLAVGTAATVVLPALAEDKPKTISPPTYKVLLDLKIAGLGRGGCDVEVKPGHAGRFRAVTQHVDSRGLAEIILKDVSTESADRECDFAITIRESGQPVRTFHRGLRLAAAKSANASTVSRLTCYLNSPSSIARAEKDTTTRRR